MMKNTISERVADFLEHFPPFNELAQDQLATLSKEITIIYKEKDNVIFSENDPPHTSFYVVHKGAVALKRGEKMDILDMCDEGDIFGLRPLIALENYKMTAQAHEETILYAIPIHIFKPYARENKEVGNFLIESFASNTRNPYSKSHRGKLYEEIPNLGPITPEAQLFDLQPVKYSKKLISCSATTSAKEIAEKMTEKKVGAMLVVENKLPIGIITDKDLRNNIVTGKYPITTEASKIMVSPVITYAKSMTITQAQIAMMKSSISHLCITKDGTPNSKAIGILSKHDLMVAIGNNPAVLIKAIQRAKKVKNIRNIRKSITHLLGAYLGQNIPLTLTSKIISELNDACIKRVIQMALDKMPEKPPVAFAWLSLGSQGRNEQLLQTDQDNALVFQNVPEEKMEETTAYFLELSKIINKGLFEIGYEYCPAEMMASNPNWCLSLDQWKKAITQWVTNPGADEILLSSIFFDYNLTYGDITLVNQLSDYIFEITQKYPIFFLHLASGALQNPSPTGFFRQLLVEQDGEHKDFFDLKRRALMPLTDAARVLILSHSVKSINNTPGRYEKLAELEPNNEEIFMACSFATKALLKFRTKQGLLHNDSGRYIAIDKLTKEDKVKLKRTFKTIKEIQELLTVRFKISNILR
ncbi:CBS domain-containing protein [Arenibacter nanhaiticus]|uniref:CBS domain-containing protein n=2 Tax=Arenibacter nanhaiticus TaxID=558155 RepID=A0A1M6MG21_9FLAO|nr:CBS domain-containing protein [Arenibacter nanhaiticus]